MKFNTDPLPIYPLPHGKLNQPIIGYRTFRVVERGDRVAIASIASSQSDWKSKGPTKALCTIYSDPFYDPLGGKYHFDHEAPVESCSCGLHSYSSLELAIRHCSIVTEIVASIVAWGKIVQHDDEGFRAQYARPIGFLDPSIQVQTKYQDQALTQVAGAFGIAKQFFGISPKGTLSDQIIRKLAEKYQVPIYYSLEAMEMAAKEYGSMLPNE